LIVTGVWIENLIRFDCVAESHNVSANDRTDILLAERGCLAQSKSRLEAENAALRHQLIVLQRKVRGRVCVYRKLIRIDLVTESPKVFRGHAIRVVTASH
jgi:hypothetical protein